MRARSRPCTDHGCPWAWGFSFLGARGQLDGTFASVAGWGDVLVGALAIALIGASPTVASHRRALQTWNLIGLADIVVVIGTAQRILLWSDHPQTMATLLELPWSLVPFVLVPLVVSTHLLVWRRWGWHDGDGTTVGHSR